MSPAQRNPALIPILARALTAGEQTPDAAASRLAETLGRVWAWIAPLCRRYDAHFAPHPRPRLRDAISFLRNDTAFLRACERHRKSLRIAQWTFEPGGMAPNKVARTWAIRAVETVADLAAWLSLTPGELAWFADPHQLNARSASVSETTTPPLHHYHYKHLPKAAGGPRLIEIPKPRLKQIQRLILREILNPIPAHRAVHGFRKGRSIVTFAAPHTARSVVLRLDLQDFFPSFTAARIQAFFRTAGYSDTVASLLTALCTNTAPRALWTRASPPLPREQANTARDLYSRPHLPQGAPTSPALANCLCWRLDCRLTGLAQAAGAAYTRYADDLAFSWPKSLPTSALDRFCAKTAAILHEERLAPNHRKTRIMRQGVRQHLAGTVVNQHLNVPRPDYDRLKAILYNCRRNGPSRENREAHPDLRRHLEGRLSYLAMIHPTRAARLRALFDRIDWSA